ncbi:MAG: AI-2E family transporter [Pseudomonadota bacterium]
MKQSRLSTIFFSLGLAILIGWLLFIGRDLILPIVTAIIMVQIFFAARMAIGRVPGLRRSPLWMRTIVLLFGILGLVYAVSWLLIVNLETLIPSLPQYEANLQNLFNQWFAAPTEPPPPMETDDLMEAPEAIIERGQDAARLAFRDAVYSFFDTIDIPALSQSVLSSLGSFGGFVFITVLYAGFLTTEIRGFKDKVCAAFGSDQRANTTLDIVAQINLNIGRYLATKSLINILLGLVCLIIMLLFGLEFAILWAIIIGLLNYIPYIGSIVGVAFPALFAVAQFGNLTTPLIITGLLTAAQTIIGNVVEPRMIGKSLNLSAFSIMLVLSFWTAIWGIPGAILAVPFTTIMMLVLAEWPATRPIAALLSEDGRQYAPRPEPEAVPATE